VLLSEIHRVYSRITSTKILSFCMKTFSVSFTNLMVLLPQSYYCSYYGSRQSGCRNMLIYTHMSLCTIPTCDTILGLLKLHALEAGDFVELILLYFHCMDASLLEFVKYMLYWKFCNSDVGMSHTAIPSFWTSPVICYSEQNTAFQKNGCFYHQVREVGYSFHLRTETVSLPKMFFFCSVQNTARWT
jgi:hypothetical protein